MSCYQETGILPVDDKSARQIALTGPLYTLQDDVHYPVENDST